MGRTFTLTVLFVAIIWGGAVRAFAAADNLVEKNDTAAISNLLRQSRTLIMKEGEKDEDLDPAVVLAKRALVKSIEQRYVQGQGNGYLLLSYAFSEKKNDFQKVRYVDEAIAAFRRISYWPGLAEATHQKATYYSYDEDSSLAVRIKLEKEALSYYQKTANYLKIAQSSQDLGDLYIQQPNYEAAFKMLNVSVDNYNKAKYPQLQGVYNLLGLCYNSAGNYNEAVRYGLLAVKSGQAVNDSSQQMSTIYNRLLLTYISMKDYKKAVTCGLNGISIARKNKDGNSLCIIAGNTAEALIRLRSYQEAINLLSKTENDFPPTNEVERSFYFAHYTNIYLFKGDLKHAKKYALPLAQIIDSERNQLMFAYVILCRYYIANGEYGKSLKILNNAENEKQLFKANELLSIYQLKFRADSALRRYKEAMNDHIRFKDFSDSLFNEKKSRQIAQLNIQFETENKDHELQLQRQQLQLQKVKFERAQAIKNMFFYIAAGLLLITGLLISLYRFKVRKNRELSKQQEVIKIKNNKLQQLLREKEWLLKEIHHRVKNNLQIVMSLLNSQGSYMQEGVALDAIQNSQSRVNSMAMIHQKLYKSSTMSSIDMLDYISDLTGYFRSTYIVGQHIEFRLELTPMIADVSIAVPLALILNEAITNSLKYAFPDGRDGVIMISMSIDRNDEVQMSIFDNGIGLPTGFDVERQSSLGINLIRGLTDDIDGKYAIDGSKGTLVKISFAKEKLVGAFAMTA